MIETNELTRTLKTLLIPKAALIAYASENERNFFLEVRDIRRPGKYDGRKAGDPGIHERTGEGVFGKAQ